MTGTGLFLVAVLALLMSASGLVALRPRIVGTTSSRLLKHSSPQLQQLGRRRETNQRNAALKFSPTSDFLGSAFLLGEVEGMAAYEGSGVPLWAVGISFFFTGVTLLTPTVWRKVLQKGNSRNEATVVTGVEDDGTETYAKYLAAQKKDTNKF